MEAGGVRAAGLSVNYSTTWGAITLLKLPVRKAVVFGEEGFRRSKMAILRPMRLAVLRQKRRLVDKICQDNFGKINNISQLALRKRFAMLFQEKLKELRESHNLLQRQVAAGINIDPAVYCKIEKGDRQANAEQVRLLALFYGIDHEDLRRYWIASKIYSLVEEDNDANKILSMVAEEMEVYGNQKKK